MITKYERPDSLIDKITHYCPGCGHGIAHRILAEVIDELGVAGRTIGMAPVGCAVVAYDYLNIDMCEAPHGRTPAVATGIKRALPDSIVFSYQGDGDLAAIGTSEIIHAANRGENITVIFINNAVYGMTGGQMAPTTPDDGKTTTTPYGRSPANEGHPIKVAELLSHFDRVAFSQRVMLASPAEVRRAREAVLKAFRCQMEERGFSVIEMLSPCPTYWKMSPEDAARYCAEEMTKIFPLGVFSDWEK
ncbi:MAG: thiamine pyrophosphate-dependent enzyme [Planctomycetota bacterium]